MRLMPVLIALLLAAPAAADMPPTPDAGPSTATIAGLDFAVQDARVRMPPGYYKTFPVAVLTGCQKRHANCRRARALIGMEVQSVNGESLQPEQGMLHQLGDIFAHAGKPVTMELYRRDGGLTANVSFSPR